MAPSQINEIYIVDTKIGYCGILISADQERTSLIHIKKTDLQIIQHDKIIQQQLNSKFSTSRTFYKVNFPLKMNNEKLYTKQSGSGKAIGDFLMLENMLLNSPTNRLIEAFEVKNSKCFNFSSSPSFFFSINQMLQFDQPIPSLT